jgi:biopolymer transport protein ExbD
MKPEINVTPLIDVLLVLLIIFMVIAPIKPAQFETKIPAEPNENPGYPNPYTLIVKINNDATIELNTEKDLGNVNEPSKLSAKLKQVFAERLENRVLNDNQDQDIPLEDKIQKTVFIKAPKTIAYGEIVKVIDEIKSVGTNPISLQIDGLEN